MNRDLALKFQAFVDGELREAEARQVAQLLETDADARALVAELRDTKALLAATFNPLHTDPSRLELLLRNAREIAACDCASFLHVPRDLQQIPNVIAAAV